MESEDGSCVSSKDSKEHDCYRIALYYSYITISDLTQQCEFQKHHCQRLSLNGRIRVAPEGINGVLSGYLHYLEEYERCLQEKLKEIHSNLQTESNELQPSLELDIKYCHLRPELPVNVQLFEGLVVNETKTVVSLVGTSGETAIKLKSSTKRRRRQSDQQDAATACDSAAKYTEYVYKVGLATQNPAVRLSPNEWNQRLLQLQHEFLQEENPNSVLLDCRNVYESSVGFFSAPNVDTILTNTRKYSELPQILVEQADRLAKSEHIFMYCTGGVRCERASVFLQSLLAEKSNRKHHVYQLHGGIQKYLESQTSDTLLFQGKNFVFDPRRTDPVHGNQVVGRCLVCEEPHDDFDNGHAPCENKEARCWKCRILVLVCDECRLKVSCWSEETDLPRVYCGGVGGQCNHMPPVKIMHGSQQIHEIQDEAR